MATNLVAVDNLNTDRLECRPLVPIQKPRWVRYNFQFFRHTLKKNTSRDFLWCRATPTTNMLRVQKCQIQSLLKWYPSRLHLSWRHLSRWHTHCATLDIMPAISQFFYEKSDHQYFPCLPESWMFFVILIFCSSPHKKPLIYLLRKAHTLSSDRQAAHQRNLRVADTIDFQRFNKFCGFIK